VSRRNLALQSRAIRESHPQAPAKWPLPPPGALEAADRAHLEQVEGVVFDVQRYSLHDGPGLRTSIFFKGCPLRCPWCSNPEAQGREPELAVYAQNCIRCGQFEVPCPTLWAAKAGAGASDPSIELVVSARARRCPAGAIRWIGEPWTAGDLLREVQRDQAFYEGGGGLTLTGGEPTAQPHLAEALLRLAHAECIPTAMETCGHTSWEVLERLIPYLDLALFDLKHFDREVHRDFLGVGNERILANLRWLVARGVPTRVRIPIIPGFNAGPSGWLREAADFLLGLGGAFRGVDLLPYHTLGKSKYSALGRPYPWAEYERLTAQQVEPFAEVLRAHGLSVAVLLA